METKKYPVRNADLTALSTGHNTYEMSNFVFHYPIKDWINHNFDSLNIKPLDPLFINTKLVSN